jgi:hypothetical protein
MRMPLALVGCLVALLTLVACGGEEDGSAASPTPSASSGPTTPPGLDATQPSRPTHQADTPASAVAYARWFARLVQYSIETRDAHPVNSEAFDQAGCTTCRQLATFTGELRSSGYWQLSDELELGRFTATRMKGGIRVSGDFVYPKVRDVRLDGTVEKTLPRSPYSYYVDLAWDDSARTWQVLDYSFDRKRQR